jgi:hypothetical protein
MGVEPLRAEAQRTLGRGPQRATRGPIGGAARANSTGHESTTINIHPRILLQSPFFMHGT